MLISGCLLAAAPAAFALPRPLTAPEKRTIGARLAPVVNFRRPINLERGSTLFVVRKIRVDRALLPSDLGQLSAEIVDVRGPFGVSVHGALDDLKIQPRGDRIELSFRYAVTSEYEAEASGALFFTIRLLGPEPILTLPLSHTISTQTVVPTTEELTADFVGYRIYARLIQGADLATPQAAKQVRQWRLRASVARTHLDNAARKGPPELRKLATVYLEGLDRPDEDLLDMPAHPIVLGGAPVFGVKVATLEPEAAEPIEGGSNTGAETLEPLEETPFHARPVQETDAPTVSPADSAPDRTTPAVLAAPANNGRQMPVPRQSRHPRFLGLASPNTAHSQSIRLAYAAFRQPETAHVITTLSTTQIAFSDTLSTTLSVPVAVISADLANTRTLSQVGNLIAAMRYRIEIAELEPIFNVAVRYAIPVAPLANIAPTQIGGERFHQPANFVDIGAFVLEKHGPGVVGAVSWFEGPWHVGAQLSFDYFVPVSDAGDRTVVPAVGYGVGAGYWAVMDYLGVYAEMRAATIFVAGGRTEAQVYLGARSQPADYLSVGTHVSVPVGSVLAVSSPQFGFELSLAIPEEESKRESTH